jgi:hypothetical protein
MIDFSKCKQLLLDKGFVLEKKENFLNYFVCTFQKKDIKISLKILMGGYISESQLTSKNLDLSFKTLNTSSFLDFI